MAGRKSDFTLPTLDELFTTQELRDDAKLSKIRDIPLELIDDFPGHPFKVRDDEDMIQLVESVKERGVITPATVRPKEDVRYELVSGNRRKRACELAGFDTLRCEVVDLRYKNVRERSECKGRAVCAWSRRCNDHARYLCDGHERPEETRNHSL